MVSDLEKLHKNFQQLKKTQCFISNTILLIAFQIDRQTDHVKKLILIGHRNFKRSAVNFLNHKFSFSLASILKVKILTFVVCPFLYLTILKILFLI